MAARFGGGDLDVQQPLEERGVAELDVGGVVELGGQRFGRGAETQVGEVAAQTLIDGVLAHDAPSASAA
jgi:hypothetical protein